MKIKIQKRHIFFMGVIILVAPILGSCATDEKFAYTNDQINAANKRIASIEESIDKNIDKKLTSITSNQASLRIEIDKLKENMRSLSGSVEENDNLVRHTVEKDLTSQDAMQTELSSLTSRLAKVEAMVNQQQKYLNIDDDQSSSSVQEKVQPASQSGEQTEGARQSEEKYAYDSSLVQYNDGKYDEALSGFKKFIEQYPKSDLADNAQFWIGECLMNVKDYEQAILAFEDVIKKYPKGNKVANAMLRQAIAFLEINDKTSSTVLLKKVIKQFPKSNEAKVAQTKLNTMK
jgi:tol-pal system protein YbgF